mmetsp:Transcript_16352/g.41242  ORF Transcript_16352/g.41242 Transcript_16352/m.41242 type:complete len:99 (-) Transcript_16352:742-1038(-)
MGKVVARTAREEGWVGGMLGEAAMGSAGSVVREEALAGDMAVMEPSVERGEVERGHHLHKHNTRPTGRSRSSRLHCIDQRVHKRKSNPPSSTIDETND